MTELSLIDAHCHLDFINFDKDRDEVIQRANLKHINNIIIPGVSTNNGQKISDLCAQHKHLHPCYGLHPYWVDQHNDSDIEKLEQFINDNACVAICECGLDYRQGQTDKQKQLHLFEAQLDIEVEKELPVVIKPVHATEAVIQQPKKRPT